ncbi:MAG TPA: deoxyribonuclease IV [Chthonomonadales bacterium]|nr:deoxyribonuclease IV [Chthonomonadales bacterium]
MRKTKASIETAAETCGDSSLREAASQPAANSLPVVAPPPGRLIGAHMPTSGGIAKSLLAGKEIGCTAVQVFTCSPRQWSHAPLKDEDIASWRRAQEETEMAFTVAHDSYLINLATPSDEILQKSRHAFRDELDRIEALGIPWLVTHMGARMESSEEEAIARLVESLKVLLEATDALGYKSGVALETTAGQGTCLGATFEELAAVLSGVGPHPRLGVCLDTCHVFVAGYDLRDEASYAELWRKFDTVIGREKLKLLHANDAKKPLASKVDRHEHIGSGELGMKPFRMLAQDPALAAVPLIVETPDSDTMHAVNVHRLTEMAHGRSATARISVQFFGHYSDLFENSRVDLELPVGARIADIETTRECREAGVKELNSYCRFAVNDEYASTDTLLRDNDSVAVLPPVSGG